MEPSVTNMPSLPSQTPTAAGWGRIVLFVLMMGVLVGTAVKAYPTWAVKRVTITIDDETQVVTTRARNVAGVLHDAGVTLREEDDVVPALTDVVYGGDTITITLAETVTVVVDGRAIDVAVAAGTVREALVRASVVMGPLDRVVPVRDTPLNDGMRINVIRVVQEDVERYESIPFRTLRWAEPQLEKGKQRVIREGKEGVFKKTVRVTYENGEIVHQKQLEHEVVEEAVARIIGVGTRETANVIETASGPLHYVDVIEVEATAYYPGPRSTGIWADGYTYTGLLAGYGVVAVDPSVIPLGTRLYIPGYGEAIAADIGGAIKGYKIDLGYPTYEEAIQYGRQKGVKVYILAD